MLRLRSQAIGLPENESKTVYIQNVNFYTSEEEFTNFLSQWSPKHVLIPYQTTNGFRSIYPRPMGVAFVEFDTVEQARGLINALQHVQYKGRQLKLSFHIPYEPNSKWRKKSEVGGKGNKANLLDDSEISKDTLFCPILPANTTDEDLRIFLSEYSPSEIWIYKGHNTGSFISSHSKDATSALITLDTAIELDDVIKQVQKKKLSGKKVMFKPALNSKIDQIRKITDSEVSNHQQNGVVEEPVVSHVEMKQNGEEDKEKNKDIDNNSHHRRHKHRHHRRRYHARKHKPEQLDSSSYPPPIETFGSDFYDIDY